MSRTSDIRGEKPINYCTACGRTTKLVRKSDDRDKWLCTHCGAILGKVNGGKRNGDGHELRNGD